MADLGIDYQSPDEEPRISYDALPAGRYLAQVIETDVKETKTGSGKYIALTWEVLEGEFTGRRVFQNINYRNQSQQVEEIGQKQLGQLTWAMGIKTLSRTEALHFIPCEITLNQKMNQNRGEMENNVIRVTAPGGGPWNSFEMQNNGNFEQPVQQPSQLRNNSYAAQKLQQTTGSMPWRR